MKMVATKRKDGFAGQQLICLPTAVCVSFSRKNPALSQLFVTDIGYYPHARFHYMERRKGCTDNILIYCLRGKGWCRIGHNCYEVVPNQYLILPATESLVAYGADPADPWTIYWVHFRGSNMASLNHSLAIRDDTGPRKIPLNTTGLTLWTEMYRALELGFSQDNLRRANLCLPHFISTFLYPDAAVDQQETSGSVRSTIGYMHQMVHEKLSVEDMAERLHLSASYFSLLFRKATGMPPMDYFIHLKIQKACQFLYQNDMKVKDVATAIGYEDPFHFSRLFKKHMQLSPTQYKKTLLRSGDG